MLIVLLASLALVAAACEGDVADEGAQEGLPPAGDATPGDGGAAAAQTYEAELTALNESGAQGTATVEVVDDNTVRVRVESSGVSDGLPHAQHIHIGGTNECPTEEAAGQDEFITTAEGAPAYGEVMVSLTTEGDVGAASALAVDRFPVAENGSITYERTFELPDGVTADQLEQGVIVQHGIASLFGDESQYDGDMPSSLNPDLPLEATIPALCGALSQG